MADNIDAFMNQITGKAPPPGPSTSGAPQTAEKMSWEDVVQGSSRETKLDRPMSSVPPIPLDPAQATGRTVKWSGTGAAPGGDYYQSDGLKWVKVPAPATAATPPPGPSQPILAERVGQFLGGQPPTMTPEGQPTPQPNAVQALKQIIPEGLATGLPLGIPGAPAGASFLRKLYQVGKRIGAAEVGYQGGRALTGQTTPELGYGAGPQALGEIIGGVAQFALSPVFRRAFATRSAKAIAEALDAKVPAWSHLPKTDKGLHERALGTGQRLLSEQFETELQGIKGNLGSGDFVDVPIELTQVVKGLKDIVPSKLTWGPSSAPPPPAGQGIAPPPTISLLASDAIDVATKLRGKNPGMYRALLGALEQQLPPTLGQAFEQARGAYRWGAGFMEFAEKGQFLRGEEYNPNRAMAALDKYGKEELISRGMDEVRRIIRGPGLKPLVAEDLTPWVTHRAAAEAGGLAGGPVGRALGGILGFFAPRQSIYRNVPRGKIGQGMQRGTGAAIAEATRLLAGPPDEPKVKFRFDPATQQFLSVE